MSALIEDSALSPFDPIAAELAMLRERYDGVVYDMADTEQNRQARSDRLALGKALAALDRVHQTVKAPILEAARVVDGRRAELRTELRTLQKHIKQQIETHEAAQKARIAALETRVEAIWAHTQAGGRAADIARHIAAVEAIDVTTPDWEDYADAARDARDVTLNNLRKAHAIAVEREAEQAELERLRAEAAKREQADRDARIAAEAAERAKREAEERATREIAAAKAREAAAESARLAAEAQAKADAERAVREREEAERRAAQAERMHIETERRIADERADAERLADERRKARQEHRATIHREALASLLAGHIDETVARLVIELIRDDRVAHVRIVY